MPVLEQSGRRRSVLELTNRSNISTDPGNCSRCINDNDARLQYTPGDHWVFSESDSITTHSTILSNSALTFKFNGSGILAVGIIPGGKGDPPRVSYAIDTEENIVNTQSSADKILPNQPLFLKTGLEDAEHQLKITVEKAGRPYILSHFVLFSSSNSTELDASQGLSPSAVVVSAPGVQTETSSSKSNLMPALIALSVIQGVIILFLLIGTILLVRFYRKKKPLQRYTPPPSHKSWMSMSQGRPGTIFTTEESILRPYMVRTPSLPDFTSFKLLAPSTKPLPVSPRDKEAEG